MIARYTRKELGRLWTDEARMEAWRRVEVACAEELEGPVDGGQVDRPGVRAHLREHLVGGRVAEGLHGGEHQLTLRGQPVSAGAEPLLPAAAGTHDAQTRLSWACVCGCRSLPMAAMSNA